MVEVLRELCVQVVPAYIGVGVWVRQHVHVQVLIVVSKVVVHALKEGLLKARRPGLRNVGSVVWRVAQIVDQVGGAVVVVDALCLQAVACVPASGEEWVLGQERKLVVAARRVCLEMGWLIYVVWMKAVGQQRLAGRHVLHLAVKRRKRVNVDAFVDLAVQMHLEVVLRRRLEVLQELVAHRPVVCQIEIDEIDLVYVGAYWASIRLLWRRLVLHEA